MDHFLSSVKTIFELRDYHIAGKLDMQKSFYFAKEFDLPIYFKFRWGKLGPFSNELSNALSILTRKRYISYNGSYNYRDENFRYVEPLQLSLQVNSFFNELNDEKSKSDVDEVYFIETLASMHFLYKYSRTTRKEAVIKKIEELKPDRKSLLSPYYEKSWNFLKRHRLVS